MLVAILERLLFRDAPFEEWVNIVFYPFRLISSNPDVEFRIRPIESMRLHKLLHWLSLEH